MKYDRGNLDKYRSANPMKQFLIQKFDKNILSIISKLVSDKSRIYRILDAGCGEGFIANLIYDNFKNVEITGLEYVQEALEVAKSVNDKICYQQGNIYQMPYEDAAFDIVICSEVLEHLQYPDRAIRELARVSGNALLLTVPDEPWFCLANLLALKNIRRLGNPSGHINHWTYRGFVRFINSLFFGRYKKIGKGSPMQFEGYLESDRSFPWGIVLIQKSLQDKKIFYGGKMDDSFYQRVKRTAHVGDSEFGNVDLSYDYCRKYLRESSKNVRGRRREVKLLDIGTNRGTLLWKLYQSGQCQNVYGIDLREEGILSGKREYKEISEHLLYHTNASHLPFQDHSFDVVCMFDVIEHIPNIQQYLQKEVRRILRPGGSLIFQTPNKPMNIMFEAIRNKSFTKYKEYHCSLQTTRSLRKMLESAGFENIVIEKHSLYSEFNKQKVKKYFGIFGTIVMGICSRLPLVIYPNLWGHASIKK